MRAQEPRGFRSEDVRIPANLVNRPAGCRRIGDTVALAAAVGPVGAHPGAVNQVVEHITPADCLTSVAAFFDVVELLDLDGRHVAILIEIDLRAWNLAPPVR